ncbi:MAG TPA: alpha/beta fold hydrolase [Acidimicrobiales bacterium]|nr:alpha/beta fold hydrolase [Acidimicrobiales bacterium]
MSPVERLHVPVDVGQGPPLVLLHGFGMHPLVYAPTAALLAERSRVIIPDLFAMRGRWSFERTLDALVATLDFLDLERVSLLGHSFGGGIELGLAGELPERVVELVFSDTLAVSQEWGLADEALRHPWELLRLATGPATVAFVGQWLVHPRQLVSAAWWGFHSRRDGPIADVAHAGIPAHVMWANRDSILSRADGEKFAEQLGATFTVARSFDGRPVDHDWMFQNPHLFVAHLLSLGLRVLSR